MTNLADKIAEALKAGRSGHLTQKNPYERFDLPYDPFLTEVSIDDPNFVIEREDVFLQFAIQVGNAIRLFEEDKNVSQFRHLLAHGLLGTGKSSLARHFVREWDLFGFKDYETIYADLTTWWEPLDRDLFGAPADGLRTYDTFLQQISLIQKPLILFVDNIDYMVTGTATIPRLRDFIADIETRASHGLILIGFIQSMTLFALLEAKDAEERNTARSFFSFFNPDHFFFPVFSKTEIYRLITRRLRVGRNPNKIFSPEAITQIADYSLGVPKVALKLASDCLKEAIIENKNFINNSIVENVVNQLGYAAATGIVESVANEKEDETTFLLTPKRRDIVANVLGHQLRERFFFPPTGVDGLRSSDLAELFGVNLSTMNYHLKPLSTTYPVPLLAAKDDIHDARSKIFYIDWETNIATALEIIVVYQRLTPEKYNIKPENILISRRENR